jgi:hypothetical protein
MRLLDLDMFGRAVDELANKACRSTLVSLELQNCNLIFKIVV